MGLGKKRKASVPVGGWVERQSGLRVTAGHHLLVRSVHSAHPVSASAVVCDRRGCVTHR